MTTQQRLERLAAHVGDLYARWLDEHEYETFTEYRAALAAWHSDIEIHEMTARPFRVVFTLDGERRWMRVRRGTIEWGRFAVKGAGR